LVVGMLRTKSLICVTALASARHRITIKATINQAVLSDQLSAIRFADKLRGCALRLADGLYRLAWNVTRKLLKSSSLSITVLLLLLPLSFRFLYTRIPIDRVFALLLTEPSHESAE
jgi:hypothetical protein